ncbi:hypothetical protein VCHC59A1_0962B, partial [Vibrio cholerae HC-59A1]
HHEVF